MRIDREIRSLEKLAKKQNWTVERTKRGHVRMTSPKGESVVTSGTPSDVRAVKNFVALLKQRGLIIPRS